LSFADKLLTCRDCSSSFTFTAGEQEFYATKGLMNEPTRCSSCRSVRKTRVSTEQETAGYERYGNFVSFGGRVPRQMHPAQCAECGDMTEVPFKPRGDRPVYCSSCYNKQRAAQPSTPPPTL
jgi:CxxC-x17-CxxC domain-containing protein